MDGFPNEYFVSLTDKLTARFCYASIGIVIIIKATSIYQNNKIFQIDIDEKYSLEKFIDFLL